MAKMYGQLPSYVKEHATLYDMRVTSAVLAWEQEQYDKASGRPSAPKLTVEEMKAMLERVRNNK